MLGPVWCGHARGLGIQKLVKHHRQSRITDQVRETSSHLAVAAACCAAFDAKRWPLAGLADAGQHLAGTCEQMVAARNGKGTCVRGHGQVRERSITSCLLHTAHAETHRQGSCGHQVKTRHGVTPF